MLRTDGTLVVTTPKLSNARGRLWMAIVESDSGRRMPVSKIDSLWFTDKETDRLYFGHLFLTTVQHLQTVCSITGFEIVERRVTGWSSSAVLFGKHIFWVLRKDKDVADRIAELKAYAENKNV